MSKLYLIRHGQASINSDNYDRLSKLGQEQARILGGHLAALGLCFDAAYSGTLERQRHTASLALEAMSQASLEVSQHPEANEYDSMAIVLHQEARRRGRASMTRQELFQLAPDRQSFGRVYERAMLDWIATPADQAHPESWPGFQGRVQGLVRRIAAQEGQGRKVALFCSGGPISAAMRLALGLDDETALRLTWRILNSSVSVLAFDQTRISLDGFNSVAHLEAQGRPELVTMV